MKPLTKHILIGSAAGAVGAFAMRQLVLWWSSVVNGEPARTAFGLDREADCNSVQILARSLFGKTVAEPDALRIALALHYGYGISAGAAYNVLAHKNRIVAAGFGTVYGIGIWIFGDELAVGLLGASNPLRKKAESHLSALAAHLLFGIVLELGRTAANRIAPGGVSLNQSNHL
jgi:hypothetical protein